jgi:asparaginyl-tRNA synthetase
VKKELASLDSVKKRYLYIRDPKMVKVLKIQDAIVTAMRDFLHDKGFIELQAPIIGPVSDPGIRGAKQASIDFYGTEFKLMSSMILYKQMAVSSLGKIFAVSPNIRIEPIETMQTGRHLSEFRQVDIEEAFVTYEDSMSLAEELIYHVCTEVRNNCNGHLSGLNGDFVVPIPPFERIT